MTEREAIARLKRGDINGLKPLVEQHQLKAVRTAFLITQDRAMAEDIVQSTFIRIYERIHQFDSQRPFEPWFMRSVVYAALQAMRSKKQHLSLNGRHDNDPVDLTEILPDHGQTPADALEQDDLRQTIQKALEELSPDQRAAIVMRYYLDMSEEEMAAETDTPAGTIKWRLHAARKRLRGLLVSITGQPVTE